MPGTLTKINVQCRLVSEQKQKIMKPLTLDELMALIPRVIPATKSSTDRLSGLKANTAANVMTFTWHKLHFLAKPNLEVLEIKQDRLYITGSSLLMTRILSGNNKRDTTIEAVLETTKQAEEFLASGNAGTVKSGFELLGTVKKILSNMRLPVQHKSPTKPAL